ncbi:hypothetical protein [Gimesia fumaroli]|uniref:Uncharacterized protein n=1 Tax=Gimesia fumaroli TaxID=2527976 RepID=A0A518IG39_9PLAN|nr:hypothetical protein [Gimesia fumaroli]QDV52050.1 hypothetical protein Enr17x_41090 [Gimesia fumaroli]
MAANWLLLMLVFATPSQSDFSVDQLFEQYEQNRNSFQSLELDCVYDWSHSEELAISIDAEIENLKIQLQSEDLPRAVIQRIKAKASPNASFEEAKQEFIAHRAMMRTLELRGILQYEHITFCMTPKLWDLRLYLNPKMSNSRQKAALARGLTSFTGGDFQQAQRKTIGEWLCLEPYPNSTVPVALKKTIWDTRHSPLPLFFESGLLKSDSTTHWDTFWDDRNQIKLFGSWTSESGDSLQLLIKPIDELQFQFVALDIAKGTMPRWTAVMRCIDDHRVETLTQEQVTKLAQQVGSLKDQSTTDVHLAAGPFYIIYYEKYQKFDTAGWYPLRLIHNTIAQHTTTETYQKKLDWRETPFGIGSIKTMQVKSIAVNDDVSPVEPLKLPPNTIILDLDTANNTITDDTPVKAADRFMTRLLGRMLWGTLKRNAAIFIGGTFIVCLIGFLIWRRLKRNSLPASEV